MDERISWGQQVSLTNEEGDSVRRILSKLELELQRKQPPSLLREGCKKNTGTGTLAHLHIQAHVYTSALAHTGTVAHTSTYWHTCILADTCTMKHHTELHSVYRQVVF